MKNRRKNYQTQWAGQFGAAHELSRRGYLVAFTSGNAPAADLLCQSPQGVSFSVEVKSLTVKTYFLYSKSLLKSNPNRFVVFVFLQPLPQNGKLLPPEYYILTDKQFRQVVAEQDLLAKEAVKRRGKPYAAFAPGINYPTLTRHNYHDAWGNLPQ